MKTSSDELRILSRRAKIAELILRGVTNHLEICRQLGMEPSQRPTVTRDIQALNREWRERVGDKIDEHKGRELARLELVEAAAWRGWDRSLLDAETHEAVRVGEVDRARLTKKGQAGDPSFLKVVLDCVRQRRALLGLDTPTKIASTTPDGEDEWWMSDLDAPPLFSSCVQPWSASKSAKPKRTVSSRQTQRRSHYSPLPVPQTMVSESKADVNPSAGRMVRVFAFRAFCENRGVR